MSKNSRTKLICMMLCMMLVISLLPSTAFAFEENGENYDDYEYDKLKTFLKLPSASDGLTNGQSLISTYDEDSPSSWPGVTWAPYTEGSDTVFHVTEISWSAYSLNGDLNLSNFDYLESFIANNNHIDSLNVDNDTVLDTLTCSHTHLLDADENVENVGITSLNLSTNTALRYLDVSENALTSLDVSRNTNLISLNCRSNEIPELLLSSSHTTLNDIRCDNNKLTALDTSVVGAALQYIYCGDNKISTLKLGNTELIELHCEENQLTGSLNLSNLYSLKSLECNDNQLTSLVTEKCSGLEDIVCNNNAISSINLADSTILSALNCDGNALSTLDVSANTALTSLSCANNQLNSLPVGANTKLVGLFCNKNKLNSLDVSANTNLLEINCSENNLSELNLNANVKLDITDCSNNKITSLDVSRNTVLSALYCAGNRLGSLDVTKNLSLQNLACSSNQLGSLDVTKNTSLQNLFCANTGLSALDVTNNVNLSGLDCSDNRLDTLDFGHNTILSTLNCSGNQFKSLDISSFIMMMIDCTDNPLTYLKAAIPYDWDKSCPVELKANGEGTVGLYFTWIDESADTMYFEAVPKTGESFLSWTDAANRAVSTSSKYGFKYNTAYNLTANFTVPGKPPVIPVSMSCTKTDATLYGAANGNITITASGGNSGMYLYSIDGGATWSSTNSFSVPAGTYTAAACDALNNGNAQTQTVMIGQPPSRGTVSAKKLPSKVNAGTAVTMIPPAAPRGYTVQTVTYSSSNPAIASVDSNGNVTFLAGGKVTIITKVISQTVDKKGRVKSKTTTVKKTVSVQQPISSISLNLADTTIARTQKVKLTASIAPGTASNKKLTWKSSNPKVAAVSSAGVVTGKAGGTAVISCTAKDGSGISASCTVSVTPIYPTGLKISKAALTLKTGKTAALKATISPRKTDFKTVTWASNNPAVATVDAKGRVKAIAPGTATITATTNNGIVASSTVTVQ